MATNGYSEAVAVAPERGMRFLLSCLMILIVVTDILDVPMSLGPGLSAKNALLYLIALALAFKMIVQQRFVFELRALHICFAILIVYSLVTIFAAAFIVQYPRYELIASGINWKSRLVDQAIFFLVFFYGLHESRNAHWLIKVVLLAVIVGNAVAFLNAVGLISIGDMQLRKDGRMTGVMGESNQDAAFVSLFLPALAAAVLTGRGVGRIVWLIGLVSSLGVIVLTASRGAYVGIVLAALWSMFIFRRYFPLRRIIAMGMAGIAVIGIFFAVMSVRYGDLLYKRLVGDTTSSDMVAASSGRLEIWSTALSAMADAPLSFITGFGWNTYWSMPFRLSPHNHYLSLWFNVGLVGLICGILLLALVVRESVKAVPIAPVRDRPVLISFAIGTLAISIATFFVDLYTPWLWFWAYAGLVMRIAVNANPQWVAPAVQARVPMPAQRAEPVVRRDPFGWVGGQRAR